MTFAGRLAKYTSLNESATKKLISRICVFYPYTKFNIKPTLTPPSQLVSQVYRRLVAAGIRVQFKLIPLVAFTAVSKGSLEYQKLDTLTAAMEAVTDGVTHDLKFPSGAASPELQSAYGKSKVVSVCGS